MIPSDAHIASAMICYGASGMAVVCASELFSLCDARIHSDALSPPSAQADIHRRRGNRMKPASSERRPIHHSPIFWIGIALCLAAIAIYLWSDDLSWRPAPVPR